MAMAVTRKAIPINATTLPRTLAMILMDGISRMAAAIRPIPSTTTARVVIG
jgi:hypothetical protein